MTRLILYSTDNDTMGKIILPIFRASWMSEHPDLPDPLIFNEGHMTCVGYEFDSEESAALFKLTHL